jgi:hypothetical protein
MPRYSAALVRLPPQASSARRIALRSTSARSARRGRGPPGSSTAPMSGSAASSRSRCSGRIVRPRAAAGRDCAGSFGRLRPRAPWQVGSQVRPSIVRRRGGRKREREDRAPLFDSVRSSKVAPVGQRNLASDRQSKPCALGLGREERLREMLDHVRGEAPSGIGYAGENRAGGLGPSVGTVGQGALTAASGARIATATSSRLLSVCPVNERSRLAPQRTQTLDGIGRIKERA